MLKLRAPVVKVAFPGKQGKVTRRKAVSANYKLDAVLSEGEQKVISLADFLAELGLKTSSAPVIFDDPITSLDYKRMAEVVSRIAEMSETRQVIVFTHNIWFTTELLAKFEKRPEEYAYYDIARDDKTLGIVTRGIISPRIDNVSTLSKKINEVIKGAEKAKAAEIQGALVEKGYEYLRNICEVIVETELFQSVTGRYQANVRLTVLPNIK